MNRSEVLMTIFIVWHRLRRIWARFFRHSEMCHDICCVLVVLSSAVTFHILFCHCTETYLY